MRDEEKYRLYSPDVRARLAGKVTVLHCTTEYPAPYDQVNLRVMQTYEKAFGVRPAYSDHDLQEQLLRVLRQVGRSHQGQRVRAGGA